MVVTFNFTNQDSGLPEMTLKKRKKTPGQRKRNHNRMNKFLEKKREEASGTGSKDDSFKE